MRRVNEDRPDTAADVYPELICIGLMSINRKVEG